MTLACDHRLLTLTPSAAVRLSESLQPLRTGAWPRGPLHLWPVGPAAHLPASQPLSSSPTGPLYTHAGPHTVPCQGA